MSSIIHDSRTGADDKKAVIVWDNLAGDWTATSELANFPATNLAEESTDDLWLADNVTSADAIIDFGSNKTVGAVFAYVVEGESLQVAYSTDDVTYTVIDSGSTADNTLFLFDDVTARYIRLRIDSASCSITLEAPGILSAAGPQALDVNGQTASITLPSSPASQYSATAASGLEIGTFTGRRVIEHVNSTVGSWTWTARGFYDEALTTDAVWRWDGTDWLVIVAGVEQASYAGSHDDATAVVLVDNGDVEFWHGSTAGSMTLKNTVSVYSSGDVIFPGALTLGGAAGDTMSVEFKTSGYSQGFSSADNWCGGASASTAADLGLAVAFIAEKLVMQRNVYQGLTPTNLARESQVRPQISESGNWLGSTIQRRGFSPSITWRNLEATWYRDNFEPFAKDRIGKPFVIAWRPEAGAPSENDVLYAISPSDVVPENSGPRDYMTVTLDMRGFGGG